NVQDAREDAVVSNSVNRGAPVLVVSDELFDALMEKTGGQTVVTQTSIDLTDSADVEKVEELYDAYGNREFVREYSDDGEPMIGKLQSYEEMRQKKMINGANIDKYPDAHICTLQEYIDICKTYGCRPMIEVKDTRTEKMQSLYDLLRQNEILESCIIISFHISVLRALYAIDKNLEMWYLINYINDKRLQEAKSCGNAGIAFCAQYNAPRPEAIQKIHDAGLTAACWTVDSAELLKTMMDCGVKYITTNSILPD
ncbi:MAG: glycerophosphodiester phosphodiesterase family protein, partial [Candidatus Fimenecus sp.]